MIAKPVSMFKGRSNSFCNLGRTSGLRSFTLTTLLTVALVPSFASLGGCHRSAKPASGIEVSNRSLGGDDFTAVVVDLRLANLELYWRKSDQTPFGNIESLNQSLQQSHLHLDFATNAGIFDASLKPLGLHVENGVELMPLNLGSGQGNFYLKPNGVFRIDSAGARIVESGEYSRAATRPRLAAQSGPLLVVNGIINSSFATDSKNKRIRSGVGVIDAHHVVFILSRDRVTFRKFAEMFQSVGCQQALYLDGEISRFFLDGRQEENADQRFAGMFGVVSKAQ